MSRFLVMFFWMTAFTQILIGGMLLIADGWIGSGDQGASGEYSRLGWISIGVGTLVFIVLYSVSYLVDYFHDNQVARSDPSFNSRIGIVRSVNSKIDVSGKLVLYALVAMAIIQAFQSQ